MNIKQKNKLLQEFLKKEGCGTRINFKEREIFIPDGGLWSIGAKKVKRSKIIRWKKLQNGLSQAIFSKKKYNDLDYEVCIWTEELRETILYLQKLEKLLKKMGYNTRKSIEFKKHLFKSFISKTSKH